MDGPDVEHPHSPRYSRNVVITCWAICRALIVCRWLVVITTAVPCRATANTAPSAVGCEPPDHPPGSSARSEVPGGAAESTTAPAVFGVATTIHVRSCTVPFAVRKKQAG
jgi:hypothetical protein